VLGRGTRRFVILTGLSGSGKTHAIRALEDLGYFCIDNLPTQLIPTIAELTLRDASSLEKVAIVVDIREKGFLAEFPRVFRKLRGAPTVKPTLIFLEASHSALVRRFSETRRPHPLARDRSVSEGITEERDKLNQIRAMADLIIDTTNLTVHELRDIFMQMSRDGRERADMVVNLVSFGYKNGVPVDADLVFDVRCLPNPHFVDSLRKLTGARRGGRPVHAEARRDARLPGPADVVPQVRAAAVRARGQELPDRGDRLHGRPAPVGDDFRGAEEVAQGREGRPVESEAPGQLTVPNHHRQVPA